MIRLLSLLHLGFVNNIVNILLYSVLLIFIVDSQQTYTAQSQSLSKLYTQGLYVGKQGRLWLIQIVSVAGNNTKIQSSVFSSETISRFGFLSWYGIVNVIFLLFSLLIYEVIYSRVNK